MGLFSLAISKRSAYQAPQAFLAASIRQANRTAFPQTWIFRSVRCWTAPHLSCTPCGDFRRSSRKAPACREANTDLYACNNFCGKIDTESVGIAGHSQGGVGAINGVTEYESGRYYKAIFAASTPHHDLATALGWEYDAANRYCAAFVFEREL